MKKFDEVEIKSRPALRRWFTQNHQRTEGVWLIRYKKSSPHYLSYTEFVQECLCFGWIDSLPRAYDDDRTMNYVAPRNPKSAWSKVNKDHVRKLRKAGLMQPPGEAKIELAKKNGAWTFLDDVEKGIIPDDLGEALDANSSARRNFEAFPKSVKRGILEWIKQAKRPATRAKRIQVTAEKAAQNIRANHS